MILAGDMNAVGAFNVRMGTEVRAIIKSVQEISYFSRGAWPFDTVKHWTQAEREMAVDFINERLKLAAKSMFPVY